MNWTNSPSTQLVQNVMMASPNGVLVLQAIRSVDGRLIDLYMALINGVAERELDCPAVEVLGQSFSTFFPHLAEKPLLERYRQVLDTGKSIQFDVSFIQAGKATPVWWDVSVVRMEKSLLITYTDITDTKKEVTVEPLVDVLQLAFDESVSGLSVFDALHDEQGKVTDFKLVMINKAGLAMSGFLHNGLLGRTIWEMYPSTSINGLFGQYVQAYETGQPISIEHYYPEYDTWREVKIIRVDQGIMVVYNDITQLKKAEATIRQHEQLLADVLESFPVGMAVVVPVRPENGDSHRISDFRVLKANAVLAEVLGQPVSRITGQSLRHIFQPTTSGEALGHCMVAALQTKKQVFRAALNCQSPSESYQVSAVPSGDQLVLTFATITSLHYAD